MRLAALYSGGKDSNYAVYLAQQAGHRVERLITLFPTEASWMYHVPNVRWTALQARALEIPQAHERAGAGEEAELEALHRVVTTARDEGFDGLVVGAVASDYQYSRVGAACEAVGLWTFAPLWRKDPAALLREYLEAGLEIIVVGVSAEGMDEAWLGRTLDDEAVRALLALRDRYGVHPIGEGGEFETLVLDAPNFVQRLEVRRSEVRWEGPAGTLHIEDLQLVEKPAPRNEAWTR